MFISSSRSNSRQSSNESISLNQQIPYAILTGPKHPNEFVDCQIIIVNVRQRFFLIFIQIKKRNFTFVVFLEIMLKELNLAFALMVLLHL